MDSGPPLRAAGLPPTAPAGSTPGTVFPGMPSRVLAHPGADSTSTGLPPRVRWPPSHLDLFDLACMAFGSGGSHVVNPASAPRGRQGFTVLPPARGSVCHVTTFLRPLRVGGGACLPLDGQTGGLLLLAPASSRSNRYTANYV